MEITIEFDGEAKTVRLSLFDEAFMEEFAQIDLIDDEEEKERRYALMGNVERALQAYYDSIREYEFSLHYKKLEQRGVVFTMMDRIHTAKIKARWSRLFAHAVSSEDKQTIHYEQFRWHIFSYERVACLTGDAARRAFDECKKDKAFQFFQNDALGFCIENTSALKAEDFDYENTPTKADTYIFDVNGKWTYVRTHEEDCGPYFCWKNGMQAGTHSI